MANLRLSSSRSAMLLSLIIRDVESFRKQITGPFDQQYFLPKIITTKESNAEISRRYGSNKPYRDWWAYETVPDT